MEFRCINERDIKTFEKYNKNNIRSIYNFITNYIWAGNGHLKICEKDNCLIILWDFGEKLYMQYPLGDSENKKTILEECAEYMRERNCRVIFNSLSEDEVIELKEFFPNKYLFDYDRDSSDYIYESEKLITLSGKKLHSKKNHINAFKRKYNFIYRRITENDIPECKELFMKWYGTKDTDDYFIKRSKDATFKLLDEFQKFGLIGGVIEVDEKLIACSIGEKIREDTALIHIEFADTNYQGSYAIMNQQFIENEWNDCKYINREEDMGDEGLRKAKESYQPIKLLNLYTAKEKL